MDSHILCFFLTQFKTIWQTFIFSTNNTVFFVRTDNWCDQQKWFLPMKSTQNLLCRKCVIYESDQCFYFQQNDCIKNHFQFFFSCFKVTKCAIGFFDNSDVWMNFQSWVGSVLFIEAAEWLWSSVYFSKNFFSIINLFKNKSLDRNADFFFSFWFNWFEKSNSFFQIKINFPMSCVCVCLELIKFPLKRDLWCRTVRSRHWLTHHIWTLFYKLNALN